MMTVSCLTTCKTLRDGDDNVFGIKRNPQANICPVQGIEHYMAVAQQLKIYLTRGHLFRPTTPQGGVLDASFTSTAAEARLKGYLKEMGSDDGETAAWLAQLVERQSAVRSRVRAPDRTNTQGLKITEENVLPL